ncbi:hypothetical protein [Falsiroseomonas sp. HW251]|uniref:hypothetical protein n=1 Tax=Falsiroseomonas sp. HW251 TaxID=3390998 RepID=UPI003D313B6A
MRKPCYGLAEVRQRWGVSELDIANFAIAGELTLSIVVVRLPLEEGSIEDMGDGDWANVPDRQHFFTGPLDLGAHDAWEVMTTGSCEVRSFRADPERYRSVGWRADDDQALHVLRERLVVRHAELERFEAAQASAAAAPAAPVRAVARGALPKYDWDEFWCEAAVRLQIDGMPESQAAMVRRMEEWFAARDQHPDRSTVKKKIAMLWRRYQEAVARLPA